MLPLNWLSPSGIKNAPELTLWFIHMKITLLSLLLASPVLLNAATPEHYSISVSGPVAELEFSCGDPCEVDEQKIVGNIGGKSVRSETNEERGKDRVITGSRIKRTGDTHPSRDGIQCIGNCSNGRKSTHLTFEARHTLREGVKVNITDGHAHIVFYSVVETEKGPATLKQQSDFRIDRPLIELNLHGHEVEILTAMENPAKTNWLSERNS